LLIFEGSFGWKNVWKIKKPETIVMFQALVFGVPKKRLELSRPCGHYTLNVARLPISPLGLTTTLEITVPRTRFELAHRNRRQPLKLVCLPIPPPGQKDCKNKINIYN
jgi:hypothetical protein